jgi:peptide/nickel transport system substrate-binding protein
MTPFAGFALETDDAYVLTQVGCLETLLRYNQSSGELEPLLATEWTQSSPTTWDFTIREDVRFQDGTELTAEAVVSALDHLLESQVPPRAFTPDVVAGVEAVDESTVQVTTPQPSVLLPYRLASVNTGILAESAYAKRRIDVMGTCTGPFTIVKEQPKQSLSLERNEDYWGGDVALATVEARHITEGEARATQVQTGEADVAQVIPASRLSQLKSDDAITLTQEPTPRTSGLYLNNSKAPFDDVRVRQAIQKAIDLDTIAESIYEGTAEPAFGPFADNEPWAPQGLEPVAADVEAARALLEDAGYSEGEISVTLLGYNERPEFADLAAVIQEQLKAIGITVDVKVTEYAAIEPALLDGSYDMALLSRNHLTDIADPIGFLEADYTCNGSYNISHYCDPAIDKVIDQANAAQDAEERYEIYADVAAELQDQAVTVFLVSEQTTAAYRNNVVNFVDDPLVRYAITPDVAME